LAPRHMPPLHHPNNHHPVQDRNPVSYFITRRLDPQVQVYNLARYLTQSQAVHLSLDKYSTIHSTLRDRRPNNDFHQVQPLRLEIMDT
jgi:hypothetical protein